MTDSPVQDLTPSESHRLVAIESYEVRPGIVADSWILIVHGTAPCANMAVTLEPAVYIRQPEYWRIETVGTVPGGICLTALRPYTVSLPLAGSTGTQGIELIGQGFAQRIDVPPKVDEPRVLVMQVGTVSLGVLESAPRQLQVNAGGMVSTSGWSNARLELRPGDGVLDDQGRLHLDFLADPPDGVALQVLTPVAASFAWQDFEAHAASLKAVVVHGATNAVEQPFSDPQPGPDFQEMVELKLNAPVKADDGAVKLRLTGVQDSRCPADVVCVWQGFVEVTVEVDPKEGDTETVTLSSLDPEPTSAAGYRLKLVDVVPYPVASDPSPKHPRALVVVMR